MENKFKDRDISFETLEKAVNGDYFAMQEVIRLFKPYMARLSIEDGMSVSEDIFSRGLCLPSDMKNTREDMERIIKVVRKQFGQQ